MIMEYKYTLDPTSKKFRCPKCEKKRLVKFINNESKKYAPSEFGRCDRESACGYFKYPSSNKQQYLPTTESYVAIPKKTISYININVLDRFGNNYNQNNFISFLLQHFDESLVYDTIIEYNICTSNYWKGATIFLQIDNEFKIRTGKLMLFDALTGKRVKKPYTHINWMHKVLNYKEYNLQQCLFGLNLVNKFTTTICVVESEKTAIIMSMIFSEYVWLATGAKHNLKENLLKPIKNYSIILYPDKTEYESWNKKALLFSENNYNISTSNLLEKLKLEDGSDLVDYLFYLNCN